MKALGEAAGARALDRGERTTERPRQVGVGLAWRQGGDTGFYGKGDTRQQWITYRDMYCHDRIVQLGPLYPLNSLMLHGPCISDRRNPSRMVRNEKSVADEIWSFFGSGTNLQELYITPHVLTSTMWDELAAAAKASSAKPPAPR